MTGVVIFNYTTEAIKDRLVELVAGARLPGVSLANVKRIEPEQQVAVDELPTHRAPPMKLPSWRPTTLRARSTQARARREPTIVHQDEDEPATHILLRALRKRGGTAKTKELAAVLAAAGRREKSTGPILSALKARKLVTSSARATYKLTKKGQNGLARV